MEILKIKTNSIAHLSYILINGADAIVIDPRREAKLYFDKATSKGAKIKAIFETHRNEDFVTGSRELQRYCGAAIYHGRGIDFEFGDYVKEGDIFSLGSAELKVLETPGHTPESISLALYPEKGKDAVAVFTGDALFVDDVGRTDFRPSKQEEDAEALYESIHEKILPLGNQVILYPAHGAGSVCGGGISDREFSTLGFEKKHNPMLQKNKDEFIKAKLSEDHQKPPYFSKMEELNLKGNDRKLKNYQGIELVPIDDYFDSRESFQVLDIRTIEAFTGCHIPGAFGIPTSMLGAYGGYFLNYDDPILLVGDSIKEAETAKDTLLNLGYDKARYFLNGGIKKFEASGYDLSRIKTLDVEEVFDRAKDSVLLDVRKPGEWESGTLEDARTIFLGDLEKNLEELRAQGSIIVYCGSGARATIGASILQKHGLKNISVFMGSMKAVSNSTK